MNQIRTFVSDWAGLIVNLITLGGWIGGIVSAVLLSVSRSKDWTAINRAFAEPSKRDSGKKNRFFLKDHDYIVGVDPLIEIASRLTTVGSEESKCWLKV